MSFIIDALINLLTAAIGGLLGFGYEKWVRVRRARIARWFWNRAGVNEVQVFLGSRGLVIDSEPGERFLTVSDAEVLGRLSGVLEEFFKKITVVHDPIDINWHLPVVSIGGGNSNRLFQNIDISDFPDFRFDSSDHYTITNRDGSQRSSSSQPTQGVESSSYSIVGRYSVRYGSVRTDLIVIAGAYGPSTVRSLVHVQDKRNLREIFDVVEEATSFQALIHIHHHKDGYYTTNLSSLTSDLESLDQQLFVRPVARMDVPKATAEAAEVGVDSPQANS